MEEIVLNSKNGVITANSIDISNKFGKEHSKVKRTIKSFEKDVANFGEMFYLSTSVDSYGREQECYEMNRDGFSLVVMGFTGKKALQWKLKYIEAFNKMEEKLKDGNYLSEEERLKLQLFSKDALDVVSAHNRLVELATAPLIAENEELRPKAEFHDAVRTSVNSISVGKFSGVLQKNALFKNFGRNKLFEWLRYNDYLCSCGDLKNKPTQKALSGGYMDYDEYVTDNGYGKSITTYKPLVTGKGQIHFTEKLIKEFSKGVS